MKTHPYAGARIAFATMHGKEQLARHAFLDTLGADVIAPADLDTDQFGTFSGEIARTLSPRAAALAKARLGMQLAGVPYGLASEGSFNSGLGFLVEHHEALIFIDEIRDLELAEGTITTSPLPLSCRDHHHPCPEDGAPTGHSLPELSHPRIRTGRHRTRAALLRLQRTHPGDRRRHPWLRALPAHRPHPANGPVRLATVVRLLQPLIQLALFSPECEPGSSPMPQGSVGDPPRR